VQNSARSTAATAPLLGRAAAVLADGGGEVVPRLLTVLAESLDVPRSAVAVELPPTLGTTTPVGLVLPLQRRPEHGHRVELPLTAANRLVGVLVVAVPDATVGTGPALHAFADLLAAAVAYRGADAPPVELEADYASLAGRLHDGPIQTLLAARLAAELAARSGGDDLADVAVLVTTALRELRRVMWELRPRTGEGLGAALEQLAAHDAAGPAPRLFDVTVDREAASRLSPAAAAIGYRLTQTVLRGATSALRVTVRPGTTGTAVRLQITGADADIPDVDRWQRRAALAGGRLRVERGSVDLDFDVPEHERPDDASTNDVRRGGPKVTAARRRLAGREPVRAGGSR
jgi:hypothetical protein